MRKKTNEQLSELIGKYKKLQRTNYTANSDLYREIEQQVMMYCYDLPQTHLNLNEDDAAEFLLEINDKIPKIINDYNENTNDFLRFLYSVLKIRVIDFYSEKKRKNKEENTLIDANTGYSFIVNQQKSSYLEAAERNLFTRDSIEAERLLFVLANNPTIRKKFYIYICDISPFISIDIIAQICKKLRFNFPQTQKITEYIREKSINLTDHIKELEHKKNFYYNKQLLAEEKINELKRCGYNTEKYEISRDYNVKVVKSKQNEINKMHKRASPNLICSIFNIEKQELNSCMYYSKQIIEFCYDPINFPKPNPHNLGIGKRIINVIIENKMTKTNIEPFFPYSVFNINPISIERNQLNLYSV